MIGFKQPTALELEHDFLWRVHSNAPPKGWVAIFNRSRYEDVLVTRVHKMIDKETWTARYDRIRDFETELPDPRFRNRAFRERNPDLEILFQLIKLISTKKSLNTGSLCREP